MAKDKNFDEYIKQTQKAIKSVGAEHKNQFADYLAEYNKTASKPVYDETDKYKVKTGSKGGFGTNYIAQSGMANGAKTQPEAQEESEKPKTWQPPSFENAPSAEDVDAAARKTPEYYKQETEKLLGHSVDALSDDQIKNIYEQKTGDYSPYLNTGSSNPYYTPAMAAIDRAGAVTSGDVLGSYSDNPESSHDGSAYWDANRPEAHNVNPIEGYYTQYFANKYLPKVSDKTNDFWAESPENMILDTEPRATTPTGKTAPVGQANLLGNVAPEMFGTGTRAGNFAGVTNEQLGRGYSPIDTYMQNRGAQGLYDLPASEGEAAALLTEYNNRMAAHNSRPSDSQAAPGIDDVNAAMDYIVNNFDPSNPYYNQVMSDLRNGNTPEKIIRDQVMQNGFQDSEYSAWLRHIFAPNTKAGLENLNPFR